MIYILNISNLQDVTNEHDKITVGVRNVDENVEHTVLPQTEVQILCKCASFAENFHFQHDQTEQTQIDDQITKPTTDNITTKTIEVGEFQEFLNISLFEAPQQSPYPFFDHVQKNTDPL